MPQEAGARFRADQALRGGWAWPCCQWMTAWSGGVAGRIAAVRVALGLDRLVSWPPAQTVLIRSSPSGFDRA